jgi:DNA repair exonuclease SbcCD ATPase subunit
LKAREKRLLGLEGECPTCLQPIDEMHIRKQAPLLKRQLNALMGAREELLKEQGSAQRQKRIREELSSLVRNQKLEVEVSDLREEWHSLEGRKDELEKQERLLEKLRQRIVAEKRVIEEKKKKYDKFKRWYRVLEYAERVFARNGLPAFLNAQLCPELNQAAEYYADLFSQGEIQVRFAVDEEGRMDVQVVNVHGGELVEDQSEGEMKIASLITSFAVRTAAPKTNLLILDEPGDGLDPVSARAFSKGLREVVKKFGTILLTSHNPVILSELGDAKLVMVVKENKISRVEE